MMHRNCSRQSGMTLVELLVAMMIMGVISTMIIMSWLTLSKAYSFTTRSDKQRDSANQALARMAREVRDAQSPPGSTSSAFTRTYADEVRFYSTFNTTGASDPTTAPRLTRFILKETDAATHVGAIYRQLAGPDRLFGTADDGPQMLLIDNVVNLRTHQDLFTYSAVDPDNGQMFQSNGTTTLVTPSRVQTVSVFLQVDLNPGKSPNYMDISTTVEPRNVRHL